MAIAGRYPLGRCCEVLLSASLELFSVDIHICLRCPSFQACHFFLNLTTFTADDIAFVEDVLCFIPARLCAIQLQR